MFVIVDSWVVAVVESIFPVGSVLVANFLSAVGEMLKVLGVMLIEVGVSEVALCLLATLAATLALVVVVN